MTTNPNKVNKFCAKVDLGNEATVEQFFVGRLLTSLGYSDSMIEPKTAVPHESIQVGTRKRNYFPDYILSAGGKRRWVCEAKASNETLDNAEEQGVSYCVKLRRKYRDPITHFMVTNGITTHVFHYEIGTPVLSLEFRDFVDGNPKFEQLKALLDPTMIGTDEAPTTPKTIHVRRKTASEINADFAWCHSLIHRREGLGYSASFMELVKVVFLKLMSDKKLYETHPALAKHTDAGVDVPADAVDFSVAWIEQRERDSPNPVNDLQFMSLLNTLEREIRANRKKRIFDPGTTLGLAHATIKEIAGRLETADLLAIDADLNGRLFETFLNATLRGKDLGQFFTPRSVVKLGVALADIKITADHQDIVLDGCCGTGGFLIDALADMWSKANDLTAMPIEKRDALRAAIAHNNVVGIDVARDPALARIARINMYLHGDGGSRIYQLDALDKSLAVEPGDSVDVADEKKELSDLVGADGFADVVLTNPPFAKSYKRSKDSKKKTPEDKILDEYELAFETSGGIRTQRTELLSGIMFMERYHDMLKPGGRIITVLDDSVLGGAKHAGERNWIRANYLVEAVISLPGDAFQRSQARVKTSILVMRKRSPGTVETQPAVFMAYAKSVGIDDPARTRVLPGDADLRTAANAEIKELSTMFRQFQSGTTSPKVMKWVVPADRITDRLDVKGCLLSAGSRVPSWKRKKLDVVKLSDLVTPKSESDDTDSDADATELVTYLRVQYAGFAEAGDQIARSDGPRGLRFVDTGDIVVSHINAVHGAVAVVPIEFHQHVVTKEFTLLNPVDDLDPRVVWALLRTPQARADMLVLSTGMGRTRVDWEQLAGLRLPRPSAKLAKQIIASLDASERARREAAKHLAHARDLVATDLDLDDSTAHDWIKAFKPPR